MCFTFKENNKRTKKPAHRFLQDGESAGIRYLQISIVVKRCQTPWNGLWTCLEWYGKISIKVMLQNNC